jgi:hypothetical protein
LNPEWNSPKTWSANGNEQSSRNQSHRGGAEKISGKASTAENAETAEKNGVLTTRINADLIAGQRKGSSVDRTQLLRALSGLHGEWISFFSVSQCLRVGFWLWLCYALATVVILIFCARHGRQDRLFAFVAPGQWFGIYGCFRAFFIAANRSQRAS